MASPTFQNMQTSLNRNCSYINRDRSAWIKGVLTFFIILGHNMTFTIPLSDWGVMSFFYTFHVHCFFLLPFLYGSSPLTRKRLWTQIVRLYWPFFILSTSIMLGVGLFTHFHDFSWTRLLSMYSGCSSSLRSLCRYQALWFLPVMLVTLILRDIYYHHIGRIQKVVWLILSFFVLLHPFFSFLDWVGEGSDFLFLPFSALRYFLLGVICRAIIGWLQNKDPHFVLYDALLLFGVGVSLYVVFVATQIQYGINTCFLFLQVWMPLVVMVLLCWSPCSFKARVNRWLICVGKESLAIYLISPFFGYACYFLMLYIGGVYWWVGLVLQFGIFALAYYMAVFVKYTWLGRLIMPRSPRDLLDCIKAQH